MAKWGEGDPRWIVENRSDAHNVNNWHWREVDSSEWSKDFLRNALKSVKLDDGKAVCNFTEVSTLEGESSSCVRKAKFICIFEWEKIVCKWTGNVPGVETEFKGSITIENFDHDSESDDIDITVKFEKNGPAEHPSLKAMIKKLSPDRIWEVFTLYKETLREEFKTKLAFKPGATPASPNSKENNNNSIKNSVDLAEKTKTAIKLDTIKTSPNKQVSNPGAKMSTKKLTLTETFYGEVGDVYNAFVDINKIKVWSQGSLKLSFCPNSHELLKDAKFSMFSDSIVGTITGLTKPEKINMEWRQKAWPEGHFSQVEMRFEQTSSGAKLTLEQRQVPSEFVSNTQEGWRRYYFAAIKSTMGLGGCQF